MDRFFKDKEKIIDDLSKNVDNSPKGSIDSVAFELVSYINSLSDYVSTSSCSGRISLHLTDKRGKGVNWIFVKHNLVSEEEILKTLEENVINNDGDNNDTICMFKCEPLLLHIQCHNIESVQFLLQVATFCGFRESGLSVGNKRYILGIRSTSLSLELPLAKGGKTLVDRNYISVLVEEANYKMRTNFYRIDQFLMELKKRLQWPSFSFRRIPEILINRWGHSSINLNQNKDKTSLEMLLIGGQGADSDQNPNSCHRDLKNIQLTLSESSQSIKTMDMNWKGSSVHSATESFIFDFETQVFEVLLISGGRRSPTNPLPVIKFHLVSGEELGVDMEGVIPGPRWGHSVTKVAVDTIVLFGGRSQHEVFSDRYLIKCCLNVRDMKIKCSVKTLELPRSGLEGDEPLGRFFHAACRLNNLFRDDSRVKGGNSTAVDWVLIHGGLVSVNEPQSSNSLFLIQPHEGRFIQLIPADNGKKEFNFEGLLDRFAHTLSNIGGNCVLLLGGSTFNPLVDSSDIMVNPSVVLDLFLDEESNFRFYYRPASFINNFALGSASEGQRQRGVLLSQLPGQECRAHHQTSFFYQPRRMNSCNKTLVVTGGGASGLAFGPVFSPSVLIFVDCGVNTSSHVQSEKFSNSSVSGFNIIKEENKQIKMGFNQNSTMVSNDTVVALFVPAVSVKGLKIWLEERNWLDKNHRITICGELDESIKSIQLVDSEKDNELFIKKEENTNIIDKENQTKMMAVPLVSTFASMLLEKTLKVTEITSLQSIIGNNVLLGDFIGARSNKAQLVSCYRKAREFTEEVTRMRGFSTFAKKSIPKKWELVGDVLLIPEEAFLGPEWENLLLSEYGEQFWDLLSSCFGVHRVARRGAIDPGPKRESTVRMLFPKVDPSVEGDSAGPDSSGWVVVTENHVRYGFDMTKVMFCSGNVTERMRMATPPVLPARKLSASSEGTVMQRNNEFVVDLYCGIGYYTVPLLQHAKVKKLIACEWNPHSVTALRWNLEKAGVTDRCEVQAGDNARSVDQYRDKADRVLLGLLPSSKTGWPLAVQALRPEGGMIHVHENVGEEELEEWVLETCVDFQRMFDEKGRLTGGGQGEEDSLKVSVRHLEKVKSYAPRVFHVVLDLDITSINTST